VNLCYFLIKSIASRLTFSLYVCHVIILDKLSQKKKSKLTRLRAALDSSESGEIGVNDGGK
jgi:hypothetical protein